MPSRVSLANESAARARVESQLAAATADADKAHEEIAALKVANRELSEKYHALVNEHKDLHSVHTTKSNSLTAQESATAALKARIVMLEQQLPRSHKHSVPCTPRTGKFHSVVDVCPHLNLATIFLDTHSAYGVPHP